MLKTVALRIVLMLVLILGGAYMLVRSGFIPANADTKPSWMETWMAGTSLKATLSRDAPKGQNPVALTDQNLMDGVHLFAQNCAVCHGGAKGVTVPSPIAKGLYQKPPQFAIDGVENDPEGYTFWKIRHGIRLTGMPSFGNSLNDNQIWTLALFLKNMDKLPPTVQQIWLQIQNWPVASVNLPEQKVFVQ